MMEVDPSTSTDPSTSYRAFPHPVVRLSRLSEDEMPTNNNIVASPAKRRQNQPPKTTPNSPSQGSPGSMPRLADYTDARDESEDEEDLRLVTRASAQCNEYVMEELNCLMKNHNDKNANFQVELSKHLQYLMDNVVVPSNVTDPQKRLNFGRLALIVQGSTNIYSKKVDYYSDSMSSFMVRLSSEIGKAAVGADGEEEEEAEDGSQSQPSDKEKPNASRKKKQQSQNNSFSLVDIRLGKHTQQLFIKKIKLRPKIFTVLFYNEQCDKDKSRVVALNPDLAGETTCYRTWAPVNEERGLLNPDCKDSIYSKFSGCDKNTLEAIEEPMLASEENLEDVEPPDEPMDFSQDDDDEDKPRDFFSEEQTKPTEQTEILGSKENNAADPEPALTNESDDPWKTLAPGDTIEDLRLQPHPPVPKFKSKVVLEIDEAYFKSWYKEAKKTRGCFGDENVHEGLVLEKEGKLLEHLDSKNKRKRIDIDSDRTSKKSGKSLDELLAHHDSDDEDVLGFSDEKPVYKNSVGIVNSVPPPLVDPEDWTLDPEIDDNDNGPDPVADLELPSDGEGSEEGGNLEGFEVNIEDPMCVAARVDGFMKFMNQKFKEDEKKQRFSFKNYCDSIMSAFPPVEQDGEDLTLEFSQLVDGSSQDQGVARQLLASLMLANHKNVEIAGNTEGTLANETLSLKLLNRQRHQLSFEEDEQFS